MIDLALLELERKIEIECTSLVPFQLRSQLTAAFQQKACSNLNLNQNDCVEVDFSGYSLAQMISVLLWVQSKKLKLRLSERTGSTYRPTWARDPPDANLNAERERDPCPLLITLADGSRFCYISHYSGYHPQPGNCSLRKFHPQNCVRFPYFRPKYQMQRMTLEDFESEWYKLHLAMEVVRRKAATATAIDPFADLPVAVGIVMATQLIRMGGQENILHDFVYNTAPAKYHIFSSDERRDRFNALKQKYIDENQIPHDDLTALLQRLDADCATVLGIAVDGLYGCDFSALAV